MPLDRRSILALTGSAAAASLGLAGGGVPFPAAAQGQARPAQAQATQANPNDPRFAERSVGPANVPVTVIEYFSLTCSHCGAFHRDTYPRVKKELVDTGRMRLVWRDFPLDQLALAAHCVARALPLERYEGFIGALFAAQDRWAFARGVDHLAEMAKIAALAGMSREQFDAAARDEALRRFILEQRLRGEQEHRVEATPTFVFGTVKQAGNLGFDRFAQLLAEASRA